MATGNVVAETIAEKIVKNWQEQIVLGQQPRILIPAITDRIGSEIQKKLCAAKVNAFWVLPRGDKGVSEQSKFISVAGLTSVRVDAYVIVIRPELHATVHESIKQTIREVAFAESWPWDDHGLEFLSFHKSIFPEILQRWAVSDADEKERFREISLTLLKDLRTNPNRSQILLDELLNWSGPASGLAFFEFLRHCGIPQFTDDSKLRIVGGLVSRIRRRCESEFSIRELVESEIERNYIGESDTELAEKKELINQFIDGVLSSQNSDQGLIGLRSGFNANPHIQSRLHDWLDIQTLKSLFLDEATDSDKPVELEIKAISCAEAHIHGKKAVFRVGESVQITVSYDLGSNQFDDGTWKLVAARGGQVLWESPINANNGLEKISLDSNEIKTYTNTVGVGLRIEMDGTKKAGDSIRLDVVGDQRPFAVLVGDDLKKVDLEEDSNSEITVNQPSHVFLASQTDLSHVSIKTADHQFKIEAIANGIYRTSDPLDIFKAPAGVLDVEIELNSDLSAEFTLSNSGQDRGDFTITKTLQRFVSSKRNVSDLLDRYLGDETTYFKRLGEAHLYRRLATFARYFDEEQFGHLPIATDLHNPQLKLPSHQGLSLTNSYFRILGDYELDFSDVAPQLQGPLSSYATNRKEIIEYLKSQVTSDFPATSEYPPYSILPVFVKSHEAKIRDLILNYLRSYCEVLDAFSTVSDWSSRFLLTNLDAIVDIGASTARDGIRLLSPWHPIVLSRRFLLEKSVATFGKQYLEIKKKTKYYKLAPLLNDALPAYWLPSCGTGQVRQSMLLPTNDPGWLITVSDNYLEWLYEKDNSLDAQRAMQEFQNCTNLVLEGNVRNEHFSPNVLDEFVRYFSSRRRLCLEFKDGYRVEDLFPVIDEFAFDKNGEPKRQMKSLIGGIHVRTETPSEIQNIEDELRQGLCFYKTGAHSMPIDITFLSSSESFEFTSVREDEPISVIRGVGDSVLLSTNEQDVIETGKGWTSVVGINEIESSSDFSSLESSLSTAVCKAQNVIKFDKRLESPSRLPSSLSAPWIYAPAGSTDPALVMNFLRKNGRALWDYNIEIENNESSSYYVISSISVDVTSSLRSLLPDSEDADAVVQEMGRIGVALKGEAERSLNKAKGCVGLVGAIRILVGSPNVNGLLKNGSNCLGCVLPVDSFKSILGASFEPEGSLTTRMGDLLAIQLWWNDEELPVVHISAFGVEAKYLSNKPSKDWKRKSLQQGRDTLNRFRELVFECKNLNSSYPIRLAVWKLLKFGIRLQQDTTKDYWREVYSKIAMATLNGNLKWRDPSKPALTILTLAEEGSYPLETESDQGVFCMLTKSTWPTNTTDDPALSVRNELSKEFEFFGLDVQSPTVTSEDSEVEAAPHDQNDEPELSGSGNEEPNQSDLLSTSNDSGASISVSNQPSLDTNAAVGSDARLMQRKLSDDEMESRYEAIVETLRRLNITINEPRKGFSRFRETPSTIQYRIRPESHHVTKTKSTQARDQIKYELNLGWDKQIDMQIDKGHIVIDAPKSDSERFFVDADLLWSAASLHHEDLEIPIGIDHSGEIVTLNFKKCAHLLVGGQTNSGKSKAIEAIICGLQRFYDANELKLILVDGKQGVELNKFSNLPHCLGSIGKSPKDAAIRIEEAVLEMEKRYNAFRNCNATNLNEYNKKCPGKSFPWWVLILDEYADLTANLEHRQQIESDLGRLGQKARAAGIHIVVSTQKPTVEVVNTILKENLPARLAFRVTSNAGSRVILDEPGAELLNGKGDGIFRDIDSTSRIQCALVSDQTLSKICKL